MNYHTSREAAGAATAAPRAYKGGRFYGLLELDTAGTVLYSRVEPDGAPPGAREPDLAGRNFYTEVAPFENVGEFRQQLELFRRSQQPASSFDFTCRYEDGAVTVRVLLARIRERSDQNTTKSVLVHIRKSR